MPFFPPTLYSFFSDKNCKLIAAVLFVTPISIWFQFFENFWMKIFDKFDKIPYKTHKVRGLTVLTVLIVDFVFSIINLYQQ